MKKLTKMSALAAGAVMVSQAAQAGFTVNDLYLGFTQSSASSDLILDLGQASSLIGQTSVVNLSGDLSGLTTFNSTFNNTANGVDMAVIGGDNVFGQTGVFATQVRAGGAGNAAVAGSSVTAGHSSSLMSGGASVVGGLAPGILPSAGGSVSDPNKTYTTAEVPTAQTSFVGKTGVNPTGTIGISGIIYEDLYKATQASGAAGAYTYEGYFTFNYGADLLTFTSADVVSAVPEPAAYGAIAGLGLLLVSLRRQLVRKTA